MSDQKDALHTPGPWMMRLGSAWHVWPDCGVQNQYNLIADVRVMSARGKADATLITAAPDLLEAAKEVETLVVDWMGFLNRHGFRWENEADLPPGLLHIRAAIAKAEGR